MWIIIMTDESGDVVDHVGPFAIEAEARRAANKAKKITTMGDGFELVRLTEFSGLIDALKRSEEGSFE